MSRVFQSLIQSDFGPEEHGNLEAVVLEGDQLNHWFRDSGDQYKWKRGQNIVAVGVADPGSIIQSDFTNDGLHGNFEVVVPIRNADNTKDLWHYYHDNSDPDLPWWIVSRICTNVASSASIIQSDFGDEHKHFEVVVPVLEGSMANLYHLWRDNDDLSSSWSPPQLIVSNVGGPGCVIQSDFRGNHGNLEVVVPVIDDGGQLELRHFFREEDNVWRSGQTIVVGVRGPAVMIQSDFKSGGHGNFELIVPIGQSLVHYWHDNGDVNSPWRRGQLISDASTGWGSLIQSNFGDGEHGNFEILADECSQSLVGYYHPNEDTRFPWVRSGFHVIYEPRPQEFTGARKIVQLTGQLDREGWDGKRGEDINTAFNQTETRYDIRGCDLGSSFEHLDRIYFLFGDTIRTATSPWAMNLDSIAFCTDTEADAGLHLTFHKQPPLVKDINQLDFNVPLDGFSCNGAMYVFFSTDHYVAESANIMGRSVLACSENDGYDFKLLKEFSRDKFVNVSVEIGVADEEAAALLNLAPGTEVVWVWGSGRYRCSAVYLAMFPLQNAQDFGGLQFFAGGNFWSDNEFDAAPLFLAQDVGELSVRWNPVLRSYFCLFNSANPRGILMHSAPNPWGPWSRSPVLIFDPTQLLDPSDPCSGAGYGRFMHIGWHDLKCDHVQDDISGSFRDNEYGGEYGPYQITRFARAEGENAVRIFFTMSTWNPYQSVLMTAVIPRRFVPLSLKFDVKNEYSRPRPKKEGQLSQTKGR